MKKKKKYSPYPAVIKKRRMLPMRDNPPWPDHMPARGKRMEYPPKIHGASQQQRSRGIQHPVGMKNQKVDLAREKRFRSQGHTAEYSRRMAATDAHPPLEQSHLKNRGPAGLGPARKDKKKHTDKGKRGRRY